MTLRSIFLHALLLLISPILMVYALEADSNIDTNINDTFGQTALHIAVDNDCCEAIKLLSEL